MKSDLGDKPAANLGLAENRETGYGPDWDMVYAQYVGDAVCMAALTLDKMLRKYDNNVTQITAPALRPDHSENPVRRKDFQPVYDSYYEFITNSDFDGVQGRIRFDKNADGSFSSDLATHSADGYVEQIVPFHQVHDVLYWRASFKRAKDASRPFQVTFSAKEDCTDGRTVSLSGSDSQPCTQRPGWSCVEFQNPVKKNLRCIQFTGVKSRGPDNFQVWSRVTDDSSKGSNVWRAVPRDLHLNDDATILLRTLRWRPVLLTTDANDEAHLIPVASGNTIYMENFVIPLEEQGTERERLRTMDEIFGARSMQQEKEEEDGDL